MAVSSSSLFSTLQHEPHSFLQPSLPLYTDTVAYLKHALDPLASDVSVVQQQRQQEGRKKRKRNQQQPEDSVLRLKNIHTDGFGIEQIWEQARRVIGAARTEAERGLTAAQEREHTDTNGFHGEELNGNLEDDSEGSLGNEGIDYEIEGPDISSEDEEMGGMDGGYQDGEEEGDDEDEEEGLDLEDEMLDEPENAEETEEYVADKFGLNDGFFSIDDFNVQSEFLEQQDARGDDGHISDEEDVDWDTNPLGGGNGVGAAEDGDSDPDDNDNRSEDDNGPIFGDPDAPSEEDENIDGDDLGAMGATANTNEIKYADFFAPPAQQKKKKRKTKKENPSSHSVPDAESGRDGDEADDVQRNMAAVQRDLFDDEESASDDDGNQESFDPSDPKSRRSTHERRKAAIAEEIRKLESANVAKREWTLSGEARAADRPMNSLLEEDLEFERAGKPIPVITAEVSESIEDLIKRRILAYDFQDIIRRRPDDLATGKDARRGRLDFELDDNKSKKGLADEYEEEHLRRTDPNFVDIKDEKQKQEEQEIEAMWKKISADLDSLSSWHFRPKQPAPQIDIRVDAPAIQMEDARPNAGGDVAGASQLAPQEIYKGGEATKSVREEVGGKSGLSAAREEMSREERRRRRRREKERIKKAGTNGGAKVDGQESRERKGMVGDLKKGGVKVIGKKGQMQDIEGRDVRNGSGGGQVGAGKYKL